MKTPNECDVCACFEWQIFSMLGFILDFHKRRKSCKCWSVIHEQNVDLIYFILEKDCSQI